MFAVLAYDFVARFSVINPPSYKLPLVTAAHDGLRLLRETTQRRPGIPWSPEVEQLVALRITA
jgi:hypothetical protein